MPRTLFRVALFLSSYVPLFMLLAYANRACLAVWLALLIVSVISVVGLIAVLLARRSDEGPRLTVAHVRPQDGDVLAYIATYLLPFLELDLARPDDRVLLIGFLLVLGVVYVNTSMLFVNPLLTAARFRTFAVTDPSGHEYTVITRRPDLPPGTTVRPAQIDRYVRLEVRDGSSSTRRSR